MYFPRIEGVEFIYDSHEQSFLAILYSIKFTIQIRVY